MLNRLTKVVVSGFAPALMVWAGEVHEHGAARLDVAIDAGQVSLHLESPLDGLVGFERAPRNRAERDKVQTMAAKLHNADQLFVLPAAAGCVATETRLASPVIAPELLGAGAKPAVSHAAHEHEHDHDHGDAHGHAELAADYLFRCQSPERLDVMKVGLFAAFPRIERLDVQVAGPRGQSSARLTPRQSELKLVK